MAGQLTRQWRLLVVSMLALVLAIEMTAALKTRTRSVEPTVTPTTTRTVTRTGESPTLTFNDTTTVSMTPSTSLVLPVKQPQVYISSSSLISSKCITTPVEAEEYKDCRSVLFEMEHDGFVFNSASFSFFVSHRVLRFGSGDTVNPFGLKASMEYFSDEVIAVSNVTHVHVQFPRRLSLVVLEPSSLILDWSYSEVALRGEAPTKNSSYEVVIEPVKDYDVSQALLWIQAIAGVFGSFAALVPLAPSLVDSQMAILGCSQLCTQPDVRDACLDGRRFIYPSATKDATAFKQLQHNLVIAVSFLGIHCLAVVFTMTKKNCRFWRAASTVLFPALTFSVAIFLHPGIVSASVTLLVSRLSSPLERSFGFFGILYIAGLLLATPFLTVKFFRGECRSHELATYDFPPVLSAFTPETSWGPLKVLGPWFIPVGAMANHRTRHCTCTMIITTIMGIILAVEPTTPSGCAAVFAIIGTVSFGYSVYLIKLMPFRSRYMNIAAAINGVFLMVPFFASIPRCVRDDDPGNPALWIMYVVVHLVGFLRSVGALTATWFEMQIIREKIWPEDQNDDLDLDEELQKEEIIKEREVDAHLLPEEVVKELEEYETDKSRLIIQSGEATFEETTADRCVLGEPEPLVPKPLPKPSRKGVKTTIALRHPVANLVRNDGPVPPVFRTDRERDYALL